jgi:hypothetical protein
MMGELMSSPSVRNVNNGRKTRYVKSRDSGDRSHRAGVRMKKPKRQRKVVSF